MDKCAKCGHLRYPGDQFDGACAECEAWAQYKIEALEALAGAMRLIVSSAEEDRDGVYGDPSDIVDDIRAALANLDKAGA